MRYKLVQGYRAEKAGPPTVESSELNEAQARLAELRLDFTDEHPAVKAQLARLRELKRMVREEPNASPALREAKAKLAEARSEFSDEHPDVRKLKESVRELEEQ